MALLKRAGYARYEVSNFALPGRECRHNLNYWDNGEYLGFGLNAHSAMRTKKGWTRWSNCVRLEDYIRLCMDGQKPIAQECVIDKKEEMFETVMLGLRKTAGLELIKFQDRFQCAFMDVYAAPVQKLAECGWIEIDREFARLTDRGMDMQNAALVHFL